MGAVTDSIEVPTTQFNLPHVYGNNVYLLRLSDTSDLNDPSIDPILVYHFAGICRYMWRDETWDLFCISDFGVREKALELFHLTGNVLYQRILLHLKLQAMAIAGNPYVSIYRSKLKV